MADFAHDVVFDSDTSTLVVDGDVLPWFFTEAEPVLEKVGEDLVPGVRLTILCSDMTFASPKRVTDG